MTEARHMLAHVEEELFSDDDGSEAYIALSFPPVVSGPGLVRSSSEPSRPLSHPAPLQAVMTICACVQCVALTL